MTVVLTALWLAIAAQAAVVERATVFPLEGDIAAPIFSFERTITRTDRETVVDVGFRDPEGEMAVTERVTYDGDRVVRYESDQRQIGERYVLSVDGYRAVLTTEREGEVSESTLDWTDDTLTTDQITDFVQAGWDALARGTALSFRLVALNRGRIVRFKISRTGTTDYDGRPAILLRMEAGSMFVRWVAPEIDLVFSDDDEHAFLESRGTLPVKVRRGNDWDDLEGRLVWER